MTVSGDVFFSIVGVAILAMSDVGAVKTRLHKAIARRLARDRQGSADLLVDHGSLAESPSKSEPADVASAYTDRDFEEAVAFAIEVERERQMPYPHEWE
ncbi:hypothetical protein [Paraburkholderia sp. HP33-1]|uniref:hypothetical protein n=1 Tax=Paraburkholderia sp. HP33-1 TaxID=2883243 RepID=UPI001F1592DB|nr:hypothetical protein [Paraburkholderia sp. HP33-1]